MGTRFEDAMNSVNHNVTEMKHAALAREVARAANNPKNRKAIMAMFDRLQQGHYLEKPNAQL